MAKNTLAAYLEKFRRVTSSENYIPEIDGLRFVAIFWVVVWMHLPNIINNHLFQNQLWKSTYLSSVFIEGGYGVSLFFMISGFVLALPFIKDNLYQGKTVSLKQYYHRRLTRLEPPYLVALVIAYISYVLLKGYSFSDLLPELGASAIYMHNIIFGSSSAFLGVAWSLEIEVQFYILAPLLCTIFFLKNLILRRFILMFGIIAFSFYAWVRMWQLPAILPYFLCYFLMGILLADLYCSKHKAILNNKVGQIVGIVLLLAFPFITPITTLGFFFLKLAILVGIFYFVLFNKYLKKNFSNRLITIIGGMCYSIYLLHTMIFSAILKYIHPFTNNLSYLGILLVATCLLISVLVISAAFYRLVEQPFMRKEWWRNRI